MFTGKLEYDTWRGVLLGVRNALATLRDGLPAVGRTLSGLSRPTAEASGSGPRCA